MALSYLACGCWRHCSAVAGGDAACGWPGGSAPSVGPLKLGVLTLAARLCSLAARTQVGRQGSSPCVQLQFQANGDAAAMQIRQGQSNTKQLGIPACCLLQGRLCVQAPLQALLFASNAAALLGSCRGSAGNVLQVTLSGECAHLSSA